MKFLVVLVCLLINHYLREQRKFSGESWFPAFQRWLNARVTQLPVAFNRYEIVFPAALMLLPASLLYLVLWISDGVLLGFVTLALHVLVLLFAFDRLNVIQLSHQYLAHWRAGDYEGAWRLLKQQAPERFEGSSFAEYSGLHQEYSGLPQDSGLHQKSSGVHQKYSGLHQKFYDFLVASYFERLFVVIFWYLLLGPAGVLLYTLARLYCASESCVRSLRGQGDGGAGALILRLVFILEWLPARALALTFSLAGDFVAAFNRLQETFFSQTQALEMVKACAVDASGSSSIRVPVNLDAALVAVANAGANVGANVGASVGISATTGMDAAESYPDWAACRIEELMSLMLRSQVIWISAMALLTVYGIDN